MFFLKSATNILSDLLQPQTQLDDEGIFGNYGWHTPIGASGLTACNLNGDRIYDFNPSGDIEEFCDCYAINVETENITWCYYYTEFPLVKIDNCKSLMLKNWIILWEVG